MNNPFEARIPNIVFDLQSPAVTEAEISQWRIALKKEQVRLSIMMPIFINVFAFVVLGITVWAMRTTDTITQSLLIFGAGFTTFVLIYWFYPDREESVWVTMYMGRLRPLHAKAQPEKYIALAQWCAQDPVLAAYQMGWVEQKRQPVSGEYDSMERWVNGAEARREKAQRVVQAYAARDALTGMSVQT